MIMIYNEVKKQDNTHLASSEIWNQSNYFIAYSVIIFANLLLKEVEEEVCQKTIESSEFSIDDENETFERIVGKLLVFQNVYTDKSAEKVDSIDRMTMCCVT